MTRYDALLDTWKDDFRVAHGADPANAVRQPFEDYWSWVRTFLVTGGAGQRGWLEQGDAFVARVRDAATADALRERVRALGRAIAAEWAKENPARRVHSTWLQGSPNLRDWGKRLERAASSDTGDGRAISAAIAAIEQELRSALA